MRSEMVDRNVTLRLMANLTEKNRTPMGSYPTIPLFTSFLELNSASDVYEPLVDVHILRVFANISFDNDANRQKVLNSGGVKAVVVCLNKQLPANIETVKTAAGTLLNLGLAFEPIQIASVDAGAIPALGHLLDPPTLSHPAINPATAQMTATWAARALDNILATKQGKAAFPTDASCIAPLVRLVTMHTDPKSKLAPNEEILESLFEPLEAIILDSPALQETIQKENLLTPLMDFIEYSQPPANSPEPFLKKYGEWKGAAVRAVVGVFSADSNMDPLFNNQNVLSRLLRWLTVGLERDDLQICSALALGNMARNDSHCVELVAKHNIVPALVQILRENNDYKVQHAVVGILKNLAVPAANKRILGKEGIIEITAPLLDIDTVKPLQFGVVGVIKHLCVSNVSNSVRLVGVEKSTEQTPLTRLLALLIRTDEVPVRSEGARVLVNAVKSIWSYNSGSSNSSSGSTPSTPLSPTGETATLDLSRIKSRLSQSDVAIPLANMVQNSGKYPVLQNEGAIALTLLIMQDDDTPKSNPVLDLLYPTTMTTTAEPDGTISPPPEISVTGADLKDQPVRTHSMDVREKKTPPPPPEPTLKPDPSLLDTIIAIIGDSSKYPPEIRSNMCILLQKAVERSPNPAFKQLVTNSLQDINTEPAMVKGAIAKVVSAATL